MIDPCGSQIAKVQPPPSPAPLAHLFFSQNEHPGAQPHARCRWSRCSWGRVTSCPCETPRARPRPPPGPSPNPPPVPAPRRPHAGLPAPHAPAVTGAPQRPHARPSSLSFPPHLRPPAWAPRLSSALRTAAEMPLAGQSHALVPFAVVTRPLNARQSEARGSAASCLSPAPSPVPGTGLRRRRPLRPSL